MRALSQQREGVSLMIGYVLLIVIIIGLSVAVFAFLRLYLPSEKPICPDDVSLIIDSETTECKDGKVRVGFMNKGLFSIDGAIVRIGDFNRLRKDLLNEGNLAFFNGTGLQSLLPGGTWNQEYDYIYPQEENKKLEIEPVLFIEGETVLCEKAIVSRSVFCSITP